MATPAARPAKKPSAAERERELERALDEAKQDLADVRQRAQEHRGRIHGLKARFTERTISAPEDFTDTGVVEPKSPTGKIAAEVEKLIRQDNYDAMISGADGRVKRAEEALRQHRADRTHDLLLEMEPAGREAVERWMAWASEGQAIYREMAGIAARATPLIVATRLYGGDSRSVPDYQHQAHVLKLANQEPPLPLPSLYVQEREAEKEQEAEDGRAGQGR